MNKGRTKCLYAILLAAALLCGCAGAETGDTENTSSQIYETGTAQTDSSAAAAIVTESSEAESAPESEADSSSEEEAQTLSASEVFDMLGKSGLCDELDTKELLGGETFGSVCGNLYGIEADELTEGGIMFVSSGMLADEVSVLGGKEGLSAVLEERVKSRAKDFEGYAPEEQVKAEKAIVFEHKGLSVLVISDNADKIKKSILSM